MTPTVMTMTAPTWLAMASLAKPMKSGNTVPPKSPIIISPLMAFFFPGM